MRQYANSIPDYFLKEAHRTKKGLVGQPTDASATLTLANSGNSTVWTKVSKVQPYEPNDIPFVDKTDDKKLKELHYARIAVNSLEHLYRIMTYLDPGTTAIIMGELIDPSPYQIAGRLKKQHRDGRTATLKDDRSPLLAFDIDGLKPETEDFDFKDPKQIAEAVRKNLPACVQDCELLICPTASHGVKSLGKNGEVKPPEIRARAFAWADRPLTLNEKRNIAMPLNGTGKRKRGYLDTSIYQPQAIIYLANLTGAPDPYSHVRYIFSKKDAGPAHVTDDDIKPYELSADEAHEVAVERKAEKFLTAKTVDEALAAIEDVDSKESLHDRIWTAAVRICQLDSLISADDVWHQIAPHLARHIAKVPAARAEQLRDRIESDFRRTVADVRQKIEPTKEAYPPQPEPTRSSVEEAGEIVARHAQKFFEAMKSDSEKIGASLLQVSAGVGKTTKILQSVAAVCKNRPESRIAFSVPNHQLGEQVEADARQLGISVGRYEGRDRLCILDEGAKEDVDTLIGAGFDTSAYCAGICPMRHTCPFPAQKDALAGKQMVVMAGPQIPINSVPAYLRRKIRPLKSHMMAGTQYLILDEEDEDAVMELAFADGMPEPEDTLPLAHFDALVADELVPVDMLVQEEVLFKYFSGEVEPFDGDEASDEEQAAAARLTAFLAEHDIAGDFNYFRDFDHVEPEERAKLMADAELLFARATRTEAKEVAELVSGADVNGKELRERLKRRKDHFKRMKALVALTSCLRYNGEMVRVDNGGAKDTLKMLWRGEIHRHWRGVPTLLADATADAELLKLWWPDLEVVSAQAADGAGVRRYFLDGGPTLGALRGDRGDVESVRQLAAMVDMFDTTGREVSVVSSKQAGSATGFADLTTRVKWATYNALRGLNSMERTDVLVLFGRSLPPVEELERQARAMFRRQDIETSPEGWVRAKRWIWQRDRAGRLERALVDCWSHPQPEVRRLLDATMTAELIQADARIRPVRRGWRVSWADGGLVERVEDTALILHATLHPVAGLVYDVQPEGVMSLTDYDPKILQGRIRSAVVKGYVSTSAGVLIDILKHLFGMDVDYEAMRRTAKDDMAAYLTAMLEQEAMLRPVWLRQRKTHEPVRTTFRGEGDVGPIEVEGSEDTVPVKSIAEAVRRAVAQVGVSDRAEVVKAARVFLDEAGIEATVRGLGKTVARAFRGDFDRES